MFKSKKSLIIIIVILLVGGYLFKDRLTGGSPAQQQQAAPQGGGMPAVSVSAAPVIEREITEWSEFSGRLEAVDNVEVKARVSGAIEKVHFVDGSIVKKGDPLFTIDQKPYLAELEKAKGNLASAESSYHNAVTDYERAKSLFLSSSISKRDYDARESAVKITEGNLKSAKGTMDAEQLKLDYTVIKSPITGKVSRAEITEGNVVNEGMNAPVLTRIVSLSPIYASFDVDEQTFLKNIYGSTSDALKNVPVMIGLADGGEINIPARIHSFDNQLNVTSGTIRVRAIIENPDNRMVPGLYAKIRIGSPEKKMSILVNEQAIGTDQSKKFVYVLSPENTAVYREVTVGQNVEGLRVVTSGLNHGDKIIVSGLIKVRPNAVVQADIVDMTTLQGDIKEIIPEGNPEEI